MQYNHVKQKFRFVIQYIYFGLLYQRAINEIEIDSVAKNIKLDYAAKKL